nr:HipA family kinase [Rheinheimera sp. F8]
MLDMAELQEKAANGRTEPWLCRLSDNQLYYVKGAQAGLKV